MYKLSPDNISKMRIISFLFFIVVFYVNMNAQKETSHEIQMAIDYFENKDFNKAFAIFSEYANRGNSYAQCRLGMMYENGNGIEENKAEAVKWYRKAAEQGNAEAQYCLGAAYCMGEGVKQDYLQAYDWYKKAAEQGNASAQVDLGWMYEMGKGVPVSKVEAVKWYKESAKQGNNHAQYSLGVAYYMGEGVKQDYTKAFEWYKKAAEQGNASAQVDLGWMYETGKGCLMDLNKAFYYYTKAVENKDEKAMAHLGWFYENAVVVPKDEKKAYALYKCSAEKGCGLGQYYLAYCYLYGIGTSIDYELSSYWLQKAKDNGMETEQLLMSLQEYIRLEKIITNKDAVPSNHSSITILMRKSGNVYYVPCKINGISAHFVFDTGAALINLSAGFANELKRQGKLSQYDYVGQAKSIVADGRTHTVSIYNIKDVEISGLHLTNVRASIKEQQDAPLLLGLSAIEKLGKITIDGSKLIIHRE